MSNVQYFQLFVLLALLSMSQAKVFSRCDLAKTLLKYKFPRNQLANWVCLIEAESSRNTAAVGPPNTDGSKDYGLFQINSRYWCSGGPANQANECNIRCHDLTNDNISDDVKCVRTIYKRHKFQAWYGWKNKCEGKNVNHYIANCPGL